MMPIPKVERAPNPKHRWSGALGSVVVQLIEGIRVVVERAVLRAVFSSVGFFMFSQGVINVLLVVMVSSVWHGGATELGWLVSAQGVGALAGSAVIGSLSARISSRTLIVGVGAGIGFWFLG